MVTMPKRYLAVLLGFATLGTGVLLNVNRTNAAPPAVTLDAQGQKVTRALTRSLQNRISSPGGRLKLTVRPTARAGSGYFSEIRIEGRPAQLKKLRVSEFYLAARDVRVDVASLFREGKVRTLSSVTSLRAVVSEDDLTAMLAEGRHTRDMGLRVKYNGTQINVTGNLNWTLINGPVSGVGMLRMAPGHKVYLDILSLKLRGVEVPGFIKDKFSAKVNPVINYEDLPFNPPFKGVRVVGTKAIIYT